MDVLHEFGAYAAEFEKTLVDDDWSRLRRFFADDAVYEVKAVAFGCRLVGPDAIFAGMKKSLDGFDRRFPGRRIDVTSLPEVRGEEMSVGWEATYEKEGVKPFVLRGRSLVRYRDGKIALLSDVYEPAAEEEFARWQRETGIALDPSYV